MTKIYLLASLMIFCGLAAAIWAWRKEKDLDWHSYGMGDNPWVAIIMGLWSAAVGFLCFVGSSYISLFITIYSNTPN